MFLHSLDHLSMLTQLVTSKASLTNTVESALLGRRLSGSAVLLGHFTWNGLTSVRTCTKLHWLIGSNIRFIGPVNSEPRVDTSKMSRRTDLSLVENIALLDNESHAVSHKSVVCAVKDTSQRVLECLHVLCSARFQDESVLAQLGLGNRVRLRANPGQV